MFAFIMGNISGFLGLYEVVNGSSFSFGFCLGCRNVSMFFYIYIYIYRCKLSKYKIAD